MPLQRLAVANPLANTDTAMYTFLDAHLVSVIVTNKANTELPTLRVTIYAEPAGATLDSQRAYITYNLSVGLGQSFETFRFATNPGDTLYVRANTNNASFSMTGILQEDEVRPEDAPQVFRNKVIRGNSNNLIYVASGLSNQRPNNVEPGFIRFNTETQRLEVLTTEGWKIVGWSS